MPCTICYSNILLNLCMRMPCTICYSNSISVYVCYVLSVIVIYYSISVYVCPVLSVIVTQSLYMYARYNVLSIIVIYYSISAYVRSSLSLYCIQEMCLSSAGVRFFSSSERYSLSVGITDDKKIYRQQILITILLTDNNYLYRSYLKVIYPHAIYID